MHSIYLLKAKGCKSGSVAAGSFRAVATVEPMIDLRKRVLLLVSELCTNLPAAQLLCTHRCAAHGWHGLGWAQPTCRGQRLPPLPPPPNCHQPVCLLAPKRPYISTSSLVAIWDLLSGQAPALTFPIVLLQASFPTEGPPRVHNLLSLPGFEPLGLFQLFSSAPPAAAAAGTHRHLRLMAQSGSGRAGEPTFTYFR